ncbi:Polysaccharide pyruvyl transferase [Maioricimonas rarisocia]|uniref:Polysaccharide pyruvyl transferase n=1 Tax=Maioricimonas rarisocia TaxID=2528026 RepID=A0A517Z322_9PLAN|nr:polysaccharide pyruvyl transferase family protein [Maioricimonas rarisocia]QDU36900.1 Polysaccharide pyruvyl transferase [Maioricimonas rarisocia]
MSRVPNVVLVGDRSLDMSHFGCQLVGATFREQFARTGLNLTACLPISPKRFEAATPLLDQADLVVINGEGSTHNGRLQDVFRMATRWPCVLLNCVYQNNPPTDELKHFRLITARESLSAEAIREHGADCKVVPDVIFASSLLHSYVRPEPVRELGITDSARKVEYGFGPFRVRLRPGLRPKTSTVAEYLNKLCEHRRLCIGRFHAAVVASILGIPFSTWESNTWKISGLMRDMGLSELHFESRDEAYRNVPQEFDPRAASFARNARAAVHRLFDDVAAIARENAGNKGQRAA